MEGKDLIVNPELVAKSDYFGPATVHGLDQYGEPREPEHIFMRPLFYFWLGADAYEELPEVTSIVSRTHEEDPCGEWPIQGDYQVLRLTPLGGVVQTVDWSRVGDPTSFGTPPTIEVTEV